MAWPEKRLSAGRRGTPYLCRLSRTAYRGARSSRLCVLPPGCPLDPAAPASRGAGGESLARHGTHRRHPAVSPAEARPHGGGRLVAGGSPTVSAGAAWPARADPRLWGPAGLSPRPVLAPRVEAPRGLCSSGEPRTTSARASFVHIHKIV